MMSPLPDAPLTDSAHNPAMRIEQTNASHSVLHTVAENTKSTVQTDSTMPLCSVKNQAAPSSAVPAKCPKEPSPYGHLLLLPCEMRHAVFEKLSIQDLAVLARTSTALRADCVAVARSTDAPILRAAWFDAARQNETETIKLLLEAGFDRTSLDHDDRDALYYAATKGNVEATRLLRDPAEDAKGMSTPGGEPGASYRLYWFARLGESTPVKTLVAAGCHPDSMRGRKTALMAAIECGSADCVRNLLNAGARVNGTNERKAENPLSLAIGGGHNEIVEILLAQPGVYLSNRNSEWLDAMGQALARNVYDKGQPNILAQLKKLDDSREHPQADQWVKAAAAGDIAALSKLLSSHGIDTIDAHSTCRATALWYAASNDHLGAVHSLVSWGANPGLHDGNGETALSAAAGKGFTQVVEYLLKFPQELDMLDASGTSLLHRAARNGKSDIVEMVIRAGGNPNVRNLELDTPLHHVALHGYTDMVKLLLRLGADPHAENANGTTPLDRAHHSRSRETVAAFEAHLNGSGV